MARRKAQEERRNFRQSHRRRLRARAQRGLAWPSPRRCTWCADGMGGHAAGEVASEIAVDVIWPTARRRTPMPRRSDSAVEEANLAIIRAAREGVGRAGMGCTMHRRHAGEATSSSSPRWATRAPTCCTRASSSSSPATTRLMADMIEAGQLTPRPRRACTPSARSSPARLGSDPRTAAGLCTRSPWKPATACFCAPTAFPRMLRRRPDRQDPRQRTASPSAARRSW